MYFIYGIKNTITNKYYIGMTNDVGRRFNEHITYGLRGYENSLNEKKGLYNDIKTFGIPNFLFKVLEMIDTEDVNRVYDREEEWIKLFNSVENGYNTVYNARAYATLYNSNTVVKDKCKYRYVYQVSHNNKILTVGTRKADSESQCISKVKSSLEKRIVNDTGYQTVGYIKDKGGLSNFDVTIIGTFDKDDNVESFIESYMMANVNRLIFPEYWINKKTTEM